MTHTNAGALLNDDDGPRGHVQANVTIALTVKTRWYNTVMARVIVEQVFAEPFDEAKYSLSTKRLDPCLEVRGGFWRRSSVSLDRTRITCEFEAPNAEAVREAFQTAGVAFERAWTATVLAIEDYPDLLAKANSKT
jgi:hypothetical protein